MEQVTKLCPNCSEEISETSTKCPYCGKSLKSWFKRHPILTIIIIFSVLPAFLSMLFASNSDRKKVPDSPQNKNIQIDKKEDERERKLIGNINFDGTQFHITNQEEVDWEMCLLTVNGDYQYPTEQGFMGAETSKIGKIEAGNTYSIGASQFTLKDGTRFNPFQTKPKDFSIGCENGFNYWAW